MDVREIEEYVKYRISNATVREYPYPHFFVENIFPADYYQRILACWPVIERFRSLDETGRASGYPDRFVISLIGTDQNPALQDDPYVFWQEFSAWFCGPSFLQFLVRHFMPWIVRNRTMPEKISVSADGLLVEDHTRYAIRPHTDARHRLVSTLFYCPADAAQAHLGTSVYVPRNERIPQVISRQHHATENFVKVATMPFIPNSLFGFVVSPNSWHGVEPIIDENVRRKLILHYAKLQG